MSLIWSVPALVRKGCVAAAFLHTRMHTCIYFFCTASTHAPPAALKRDQALSNMVWALAMMRVVPSPSWHAAFLEASRKQLPSSSPQVGPGHGSGLRQPPLVFSKNNCWFLVHEGGAAPFSPLLTCGACSHSCFTLLTHSWGTLIASSDPHI